ncbi:acetyl-CoA carboxylase biotin carboxyl carrier protein [Saccharothrix australiensis]|uniref:Biotin carboxyl carrier protein of acetyl-CoA carboxylase n=1 Tax=Saccharothrix australiensis TaxID=2072 RepID=A0A495VYX3_9PSEU|nr:biotin/lipoyl-containing protein [Saccharothrix australiensis]RKT53615.1 acetyl-CoA carboxylase biotin carboxyl carrier protein [Saccharothrix australiensis]
MDDRLANGPSTPHDDASAAVEAVRRVLALLGAARAGQVRVRNGRFELDVTLHPGSAGVHGDVEPAEPGPSEPQPSEPRPAGAGPAEVRITAPAIGVFHRRSAPGEPPLVQVGDQVEAGRELGLIEAMKAFIPVVADRPGTVGAIHVEDAEVVEYGQVLIDLVPDPVGVPEPRVGAP